MTKKPLVNEHHVEYLEGSLPIILSAPHGGVLKPKHIKTRNSGVFDIDANTAQLTHEILDEFFFQTNQYPHTVIMNLSRTKVDANREKKEAISNCEHANNSYEQFHEFIDQSVKKVEKQFQKGIYIDIHGQSHSHGHIEFGYLLFNDCLKHNDEELEKLHKCSSITTLSQFSPYSFVEQIKGDYSLSQLMHTQGFKSIPSQQMPYAKCGNYFEGAYNTQNYSSQNGSMVSSIQAEFPFKGCRDTKKNRQKTAKAFVQSLITFIDVHFNIDLKK